MTIVIDPVSAVIGLIVGLCIGGIIVAIKMSGGGRHW